MANETGIDFSDEREYYFSSAIEKVIQNGNTGYLPAFYNSLINNEGIRFNLENFKNVMDENDVLYNWKVFPAEFIVTIRFSPIAFFKKWILSITNKPFIKVSEYNTPKMFEREFFFLFIDTQLYLFPVTNNLSHERFLYRLYFKSNFKEKNITFSTYFNDQKKLVVYRDYYRHKISTIPFPGKNFVKNKLYPIRISVIKGDGIIRYLIYVNNQKINHNTRIERNTKIPVAKVEERSEVVASESEPIAKQEILVPVKKASKKKSTKTKSEKINLADCRREVLQLLAKNHQKEFETNKFANVSLGRMFSIPVLVNLSQKYKNIKIKLVFKSKEEVLQVFSDDTVVKTFSVSFSPKSNWLERS